MTVRELREKYLRFFESKGHTAFPSGSLIPYDVTGRLDESLLFNGAGMIQFKPYFRGVAEPPHRRLTTCQKCVRTGDIEEVGDDSHLTFFEMLGNFSFGDYFRTEAIAYSWEFLTDKQWLGLDPHRLAFTVFIVDDEAYNAWAIHLTAAGIEPASRVFRLGEETNYWPAGAFSGGPPGPCGPNSEMFYWTGDLPPVGPYAREDYERDEANGLWLEIWNDVFIQYEWQGTLRNRERPGEGFEKTGMPDLPFCSIDTGMGLDRTAAVLMGKTSVYETDVFVPILARIADLAPSGAGTDDLAVRTRAERIVADHLRTASFCIADGILPGNAGRGYVLRRLIRRAVLQGQRALGFDRPFLADVFPAIRQEMSEAYPELEDRAPMIVETLRQEETLFRRTLQQGSRELVAEIKRCFDDLLERYPLGPLRGAADQLRDQFLERRPYLDLEGFMQFPKSVLALIASGIAREMYLKGLSPDERAAELKDWNSIIRLHLSKEKWPVLSFSGEEAFKLSDTFGFPLEVTQELVGEYGLEVDLAGYETARRRAQELSRGAHGMDSVYGGVSVAFAFVIETPDDQPDGAPTPTQFVGYDRTQAEARIVGAVAEVNEHGLTTGHLAIALDQTPFYAESGGQVSDEGDLIGGGFHLRVLDMVKQDGVFVHLTQPADPAEAHRFADQNPADLNPVLTKLLFNQMVDARVDEARRGRIRRNHTATHLLHAALRAELGAHVTQAGSQVGPDHLRFDFTHGAALSPEQLAAVEARVNAAILANDPVTTHVDIPIAEARARGAMALFGEKYGDRVRMVEVGDGSRELCGGIHVRTSAEIGLFRILSEASAASGVRRIEALTGEGAIAWVHQMVGTLRETATSLKVPIAEVPGAVTRLQEQLKEERRRREKLAQQGAGSAAESHAIGPVELAVQVLMDADPKDGNAVADRLTDNLPLRIALVAVVSEGRITFTAKVGEGARAAGAHAGNLLKEVARIAGGGGGGRPDFATAGGKDPAKLTEALAAAPAAVAAQVGAG